MPGISAGAELLGRLTQMRKLVAAHDHFWRSLAQSRPTWALVTWIGDEWEPWLSAWHHASEAGALYDEAALAQAAGGLLYLRELASARGVPVPDVGNSRLGFLRGGWDSQRDPSYQAGLRARPANQGAATMIDVGRHFGGHFGGGGRGSWGGPSRRPRFDGGTSWWYPYPEYYYAPYPSYGYPGYPYSDDDAQVSGGHRRHRGGISGPGSESGPSGPTPGEVPQGSPDNELFAILPTLAPGASGIQCNLEIGPDMQLRVSICADGRCYSTVADLSGLLAQAVQGAGAPPADPRQDPRRGIESRRGPGPGQGGDSLADPSAAMDDAVQTAGEMIVGALFDQHVTVTAGFWSALKGVYRTASTPVTWFNKQVAKGLKKLEPAVTIAATAVATAYGGPAAGAAAGRLTGPLLDSSAETGGDPTKLFDQAKETSNHDPQVSQALDDAHKAIAQTTAAYHLVATAADAVGGDGTAARKIKEVEQAASDGHPAAAQAMSIIAQAFKAYQGDQGEGSQVQDPMPPVDAPPTTSGATSHAGAKRALRAEGSAAARAGREQTGNRVWGYMRSSSQGSTSVDSGVAVATEDTSILMPFSSVNKADDWFGSLDPADVAYAAYYDAADPTWPEPLNEAFGRTNTSSTVSGALGILPWLAVAAAGGLGWAGRGWWDARRAHAAAVAATPGPAKTSGW